MFRRQQTTESNADNASVGSARPSMQTLKGIFGAPKMKHRRDFLRENKLSVREQQHNKNVKETNAQQQAQLKQQRQNQQHQQQQQMYMQRRSLSQNQREPNIKSKMVARSISQQRLNNEPDAKSLSSNATLVPTTTLRCTSCSGAMRNGLIATTAANKNVQTDDINDEAYLYDALKNCASDEVKQLLESIHKKNNVDNKSLMSARSHNTVHSQYHQQNAYADGAAGDSISRYDAQSILNYQPPHLQDVSSQQLQYKLSPRSMRYSEDGQNLASQHNIRNGYAQHDQAAGDYDVSKHFDRLSLDQQSTASCQTLASKRAGQQTLLNSTNYDQQSVADSLAMRANDQTNKSMHSRQMMSQGNGLPGPDYDRQSLLSINSHAVDHLPQALPPSNMSVHSRLTQGSLRSQQSLAEKKSIGSLHQMGSRADIRLPRYLEREKREKEEKRLRDNERDPNCPHGHYVLSDSERLAALSGCEHKFRELVDELNRMPVTKETLRMRARKQEIEKELAVLESDMRIFSKPKVYVKQSD